MEFEPRYVSPEAGLAAVQVARNSLDQFLRGFTLYKPNLDDLPQVLREDGACFITITRHGSLRGCMGHTSAQYPLAEDVARNATAAARDFRFPPVVVEELSEIRLEVTILSPLIQVIFSDFDDLIGRLRPEIDGVMLSWQMQRGLLLPQVWRRVPGPAAFLEAIASKASIPPKELHSSPPSVDAYIFQVQHFCEPGYREPGS